MKNILKFLIIGLGAILFNNVALSACAIEYGERDVCLVSGIENDQLASICSDNGGDLIVNRTKGVLDYSCEAPGDVVLYSINVSPASGLITISNGQIIGTPCQELTISRDQNVGAYTACLGKLQSQAASLMFK